MEDLIPFTLQRGNRAEFRQGYRDPVAQAQVRAEDVVVGDKQRGEGHGTVLSSEATGRAHVVFVGAIEAFDELFEGAKLGGDGVAIFQADHLPQGVGGLGRGAVSVEEVHPGLISRVTVGDETQNRIKTMNKTTITGFRRVLEAKRLELLQTHLEHEGLAAQRVPDSMEEMSLEVQRHMAVDALNRRAALLFQVTEALERISGGKYGVCAACQEAISPKRLAALPWAALCIECQQAAENRPDTEAEGSLSLKLGYGLADSGERPAHSPSGHDRRLRRLVIPRASANRGANKSEARV